MKKTKNKSVNCVALKNKIQEKLYSQTKNLTHEEEIAFYKNSVATGPLGIWWSKVTTKNVSAQKTNVRK